MDDHVLIPEPSEAPAPQTTNFADWIFSHPYKTASVIGLLFVLGGGALVLSRAPVSPGGSEVRWQGGGYALFSGGTKAPETTERVRTEDVIAKKNPSRDIPVLPVTPQVAFVPSGNEESEIDELLASLTQPSGKTTTPERAGGTALVFIPQGLISTSSPEVARTPAQNALYDYANTVGTYVRGVESSNTGMIQTLTAVLQDRGNQEKITDAEEIATSYARLAEDLKSLSVPKSVQGLHTAFVSAHESVANNLRAVVRSTTDDGLVTTIGTYNESADAYIRAYLALVTFFESEDVRFDRLDPGSLFTFSSASL